MTMEERFVAASLAMQMIIDPICSELAKGDLSAVESVRAAFHKVERLNPGFAQDFVTGVCATETRGLSVPETLLSMSSQQCPDYELNRSEQEFQVLTKRASHLKSILSRIPHEINDRGLFLQTIKDIAGAIKDILDAINDLTKKHPDMGRMREYKRVLDHHKRLFVKHSKSFSDTLKTYFKDSRTSNVFASANCLVNQTNTLLLLFAKASNG